MKKILVSLSVIGVVAVIAIGATIAYFNDVETSAGNTMTAGTLDLEFKKFYQWNFPFTDVKPGDCTGPMEVDITMAPGSNAPNHIEFDIDVTDFVDWPGESGGTNTVEDFKKQIKVKTLSYTDSSSVNLLSLVDDNADENPGFISLYDVQAYGVFDDLPSIGTGIGGVDVEFCLPTNLPDANDNKYQKDSINIVFEFGATQVAGQDVLTD